MRLRILAVLFLFLSIAESQEMMPLSKADKNAAAEKIGTLLIDNYVFADVGKQCAEHLKSQASNGVFDSFNNLESFAEALTKDLQSISHDKHMRVRPAPGRPESIRNPLIEDLEMHEEDCTRELRCGRAEILEGNIGVLDIRFFPGTQAARPTDEQAVTATFTVAP